MKLIRAIGGFILSLVFLSFFLYIISGSQWLFNNFNKNLAEKAFSGDISASMQNAEPNTGIKKEEIKSNINTLPEPEINAEASISVETNFVSEDRIIFQKDSEKKLPIASLTKLMSAVVVLDNYSLLRNIRVSVAADLQDPIKQDVKLGDNMSVENFLNIMLVGSSNKSAYALSEVVGEPAFVGLMNEKVKEIGLKNTFFADPTGLSPENISTASDLAKLAEYILKNYPKIADISRVKELFVPNIGKITNTDQLLGEMPEIVCGKTGFTTQAKGCLLLVTNNPRNKGYLINVILGADDRFSEMKKLINYSSLTCN